MKALPFFLLITISTIIHAETRPSLQLTTYTPSGTIYHEGWIDFNKNGKKDVYEDPSAPVEARIENLLQQMTMEEKTCQMVTLYGYRRVLADDLPNAGWKKKLWKDGIGAIDEHLNGFVQWGLPPSTNPNVWPASRHAWAINEVQRFFVEETRLGIPADMTNEGIRGVEAYRATCFPTQLGLGHTWNRTLVREVGRITGREARALGYTNVYAPILDVGRDQRWGRYEEVYGESPFLVAELGIEMTKGLQENHQVAATAKHYLAYSNNKGAREAMARVDPQMPPREMEELHVYPFSRVIREAGILGMMSTYADYDGEPLESSYYWLMERLRNDFGFRGYVVSDSDAVEYLHSKHRTAENMKESVRQSVLAGLNVRCNFSSPDSYVKPLRELVREGAIPETIIDERVRDILRVKFMVGLFDDPYIRDLAAADKIVEAPEHLAISLRAARESLVLLKNHRNTLPLDLSKIKTIAVCGPNAMEQDYARTHYGPLAVPVTTVLDGIRARVGEQVKVLYAKGCETVDHHFPDSEIMDYPLETTEQAAIDEAVANTHQADVVIAVMGGNQRTCGENKSRTSLELPGRQNDLLKALHATGKPVILVLINGRPLSVNWAARTLPAILEAWYPGAQGGLAVAEALFGDYNPGGRLTVTFPKSVGQIPYNFPTKPGTNANGRVRVNGALWGFGYGLSYTTFKYAPLTLSAKTIAPGEDIVATTTVTNTGKRAGDEVVQLYIRDNISSVTTYEWRLAGFERIHLTPGESRTVSFTVGRDRMSLIDAAWRRTVEPGTFTLRLGPPNGKPITEASFRVQGEDPAPVAIPRPAPANPLPAHIIRRDLPDAILLQSPTQWPSAIIPNKCKLNPNTSSSEETASEQMDRHPALDDQSETTWNAVKGDMLTLPIDSENLPTTLQIEAEGPYDATVQLSFGGGQFLDQGSLHHNAAGTSKKSVSLKADGASHVRLLITSPTAVVREVRIL